MRLSEYAKYIGIHYKTAWRWARAGIIKTKQLPTGTIFVEEPVKKEQRKQKKVEKVYIYTRVSAAENKSNLEAQGERLVDYCIAKGYQIHGIIKEIGSGVNDHRPKLLKLLSDRTITRIVVEHKDRLTRVGFAYLETLLELDGRVIEVVNLAEDGKEDLMQDFVSIVTSFCARLYGLRRSRRKTEKILEQLKDVNKVS